MKLARLLANDEIFLNANERAIQRLLTLLKAEHKKLSKKLEFKSFVESQARLQVKSKDWQISGQLTNADSVVIDVAKENIDDLFDMAGRKMAEGLHKKWWKYRVQLDLSETKKQMNSSRKTAKLETIAFCVMGDVLSKIDNEAQKLTQRMAF